MVSAHLTSGARVTLLRRELTELAARYTASVELPQQVEHLYIVEISVDTGELTLELIERRPESTSEAPAWTLSYLRTLARQAARTGMRTGAWPRKVRQWRPDR